jgi:hypothetical protein
MRKPGEGIPVTAQWGNPVSLKAYGHSSSEHGAKRPPQQLKDRAKGTGTAQGQWADDALIVEAEQLAPLGSGPHDVDMGKPVGRVFKPDGTVVPDVTRARVVRKKDNTVATSFPIE